MTDTDKLKRLAEAPMNFGEALKETLAAFDFMEAASPQAILTLIAERDEAVALLREVVRHNGQDLTHNVSYFLARIDAANNTVA